jgi:hypothetical protein
MHKLAIMATLALAAPVSAQSLGERVQRLPKTEWVFQALNVADAATTIYSLDRGYTERNPFLGRNPSHGAIIGQTVAIGVLHAVATSYLQDRAPLCAAVRIY